MTTTKKGGTPAGFWEVFGRGTLAGIISLGFLFILRLAGLAPFPPESALEALLKIIPESIQEPSVQALGGLAGKLGLLIATILAIVVYGIFGILFEKVYAPRMLSRQLSRFEKFLVYSLIPWLFFGLVVLPLSGVSVFGVGSTSSSATDIWLYPLSLLVGNLIFGTVLSWEYRDTRVFVSRKALSSPPSQLGQPKQRESPGVSRRAFVEKGAIALASLALMVSSIDSVLSSATGPSTPSSGAASGTPINLSEAPSIFDDPRLAPLVDSEVTANGNFYQVDIDVFDPSIDVSTWSLQVSGLVNNPKTYTLDQLQALPLTEEYNTFECVSNLINGNLISNGKWSGVKLTDLFNDVGGLQQSSQYVVFYSVDGYSVGIPVSRALMPDSMIAYQMNGVPLPQSHGYPLRAVIPGLYGMMSAKWLRKIQVIDTSYMGYWQTRGWSDVGTVQTVSFIILPGDGSSQSLSQNKGTILIGGYAYAGARGISKVEVSTDGGKTWQRATLKPPIAENTWELWAYSWQPPSTGTYNLYARATDGTGDVQTSVETDTFPNGATGYAMTSVTIVK